jgi:hypothetical protein
VGNAKLEVVGLWAGEGGTEDGRTCLGGRPGLHGVRLESWCGHAVPERDNFKEELWQNDHGSKKKKIQPFTVFRISFSKTR